jgi:hypothetical protein
LLNLILPALADFDRAGSAGACLLQVTDLQASHPHYSIFLMCRHIALHDGLHGYRIEESALGSHWPTER